VNALDLLEPAGNFATQFRLTSEEDFDPLRDDARFKKILERASQKRRD
jgi:hypothetical protein